MASRRCVAPRRRSTPAAGAGSTSSLAGSARRELTTGGTITPEQLDRLINVNQIRHHLATTAMTTKAADNVAMAFTRHLARLRDLIKEVRESPRAS
jgi:hypothetical protein